MEHIGNLMQSVNQEVYGLVCDAIDKLAPNDYTEIMDVLYSYELYENARPTTRYGQCNYGRRTIQVHPILHEHEGEYQKTLIHEIAHAIEHAIFGKANHGKTWIRTMKALGQTNITRCNSLGALNKTRKWTYTCSKCSIEINKSRKLKHVVYHKPCGRSSEFIPKQNW